MAITYTWKVTGIKKRDEGSNKDAVVQTYWEKTGKDSGGNEGIFSGATPFSSTSADPFVKFADLKEADVLTWIKSVADVDGTYKEHINAQIQKQIDEKITPVVEADMPWAPKSDAEEDKKAPADSGE